MSACEHLNFDAEVDVNRLNDVGAFMADIRIKCHDCGHPFQFPKLGSGIRSDRASTSIDGQELHVPIKPKGGEVFPQFPGFSVRFYK